MSEDIWHKCSIPFIPRPKIGGGWTNPFGQVWRRRRPDGKWEYQQDAETEEEFADRQI